MNARKRKASDHLLPTTQTKHSRTEKLRTKDPFGMITSVCQGMQDGWNYLCGKSMPSPPPINEHDASQFLPLPPNRPIHTVPAPHPTIPPRLPIPSEFHSHKSEARPQHSNLSSSFPSNSNSMKTLNSSGTSPQSATSTEMTSISSKPTSLPRHHTMDASLAECMRRSRTTEQEKKAQSHMRARPHIYQPRHKANVQEMLKKDREDLVNELYFLRCKTGYGSDLDTFKSFLGYQVQLEHTDKKDILSSSQSLTDLRVTERTPGPPQRHSFSDDVSLDFLRRAISKAKQSLNSPPPPKPFSLHNDLCLRARQKDEAINQRLRPSLPKSLPADLNRQVDAFLAKKGVISKVAREQVCDKDLLRLLPEQWLNDEIINFYGAMILSRSESCKENPGSNGVAHKRKKPLDVHYFNTFFWSKLQTEGYERARLAKWTKKFDIFSKDVVLVPINHHNSHWTAAAINFRRKRIESYDSMNIDRRSVFKGLRHYLELEHQNKKKKPFDFTGWEDYDPEDTPQQENGYDCGVFTCQFLEALSRGEEVFNFSQRNMPYLRRRMIWEVGYGKFLDGP